MTNYLKTNVGVYALLIKDKKYLLLHQPNNPIWCALGGRMDEHELDPIKTLQREVKEEINVDVKIEDVFDIKFWSINDKDHRMGVFYIAHLVDENADFELSDEHDKYKFFTCDEAIEMLSLEARGKVGIELAQKLKEKGLIE